MHFACKNGHISTSALKSGVIIVFLDPDFRKDETISAIYVYLGQQTDRQTDLIICPMLYAIAMRQIITATISGYSAQPYFVRFQCPLCISNSL